MNDKDWNDWVTGMPGTPFGDMGRQTQNELTGWSDPANPFSPDPPGPAGPRPSSTSTPVRRTRANEKDFSVVFALIGLLVGVGVAYSEANPESPWPLAAGLFGGYLAGRLYKLILFLAAAAFLVWAFTAA